jgi:hypothetical protein
MKNLLYGVVIVLLIGVTVKFYDACYTAPVKETLEVYKAKVEAMEKQKKEDIKKWERIIEAFKIYAIQKEEEAKKIRKELLETKKRLEEATPQELIEEIGFTDIEYSGNRISLGVDTFREIAFLVAENKALKQENIALKESLEACKNALAGRESEIILREQALSITIERLRNELKIQKEESSRKTIRYFLYGVSAGIVVTLILRR